MRLLISCTKQLILADTENRNIEVIESHRPGYYGISWTEDGQELCLSHSGLNAESLDSMEAYMESDVGSLSVGDRVGAIGASAPHQILCAGDLVIVVNTGRNCLTLVDRRSLFFRHVWLDQFHWDRKSLADRPGSHFNSVFLKGDRLYVMAHNWDRGSWVQVLSWPDLAPVDRIETPTLSAHNVWVTDDDEVIVCDSYRGSLVEARSGRALWSNGVAHYLTRGLACDGQHVFIGQVRAGGRAARAECDSGVWVLERKSWKQVDFLSLPRSGDVHEVRLPDVADLCHHRQPYLGPLIVDRAATSRYRNVATCSLSGCTGLLDVSLAGRSEAAAPMWNEVFGRFEVFGAKVAPLELAVAVAEGVEVRDVSVTAEVSVGPGATQHAGVVARYVGPAEKHMIVGLLSNNGTGGQAELWEQDGQQWHRLGSHPVPNNGVITLQAVGRRLDLQFNGQTVVQADQIGEPVAGTVGIRSIRGMIGKCIVRDANASLLSKALPWTRAS